jgi:hypothetical protein
MNFGNILEEFLPDGNINYWDDLIGHIVEVDCKSWDAKYATETWGVDYTNRTTKGTIKKVHVPRGKKAPWFEIFFPDCKITYNKLDMEYVLQYSRELPQKYNEIKAKYIVELSRVAALEAAEQEEMNMKPTAENKEASASKSASGDTPETTAPKKKGGSYFCVSFSCHGFIIEIVIKYFPHLFEYL